MTPEKPSTPSYVPSDRVALWIRRRREALGLSVTELAERLGVTPSFISQIESGQKRPTIENARAMATILRASEPVFESWVQSYRPRSPDESYEKVLDVLRFLASANPDDPSDTGKGATGAAGELSDELETTMAEFGSADRPRLRALQVQRLLDQARVTALAKSRRQRVRGDEEPARLLPVPLIKDGCDPGPAPGFQCRIERTLSIDRSILGRRAFGLDFFAFMPSAKTVARVADVIHENDLVIVSREPSKRQDRLYAVVLHGKLVVSHLTEKEGFLLLVPTQRGVEVDMIPLHSGRAWDHMRGEVVAVVKTWG